MIGVILILWFGFLWGIDALAVKLNEREGEGKPDTVKRVLLLIGATILYFMMVGVWFS